MLGCEGEDLGLELKLSSDRYLGRPLDNRYVMFDIFIEEYVNIYLQMIWVRYF